MLRNGVNVSFSCRGGACHVCVMRSETKAPIESQEGLRSLAINNLPKFYYTRIKLSRSSFDKAQDERKHSQFVGILFFASCLRIILEDFYTRIYADARLAPFFADITKTHSIGKQYYFLYKIFTGEDVYFGEDMTNAHHWMVISNELFNYRETLFETTLRDNQFPEPFIKRFRALSERYCKQIVKPKAINRVIAEIELPHEGFGEITLDIGTLCDHCQSVVESGEAVSYHLRLGIIYCKKCNPLNKDDS